MFNITLQIEKGLLVSTKSIEYIMKVVCKSIWKILTSLKEKTNAHIQGVLTPKSRGSVEVFPEFVGGLKDIDVFSHLILIYHFHKSEDYTLLKKPFLDKVERGIFSIRH